VFQAIGGNIVTASPISDLNPLLLASGCNLTLASKGLLIDAVINNPAPLVLLNIPSGSFLY